jgi:hypothetical protein
LDLQKTRSEETPFVLLPDEIVSTIAPFTPLFSDRVWKHAETLIVGAILARSRRTVASALRAAGAGEETHFTNYHRVLNRVRWDSLAASRILLGLIVTALVATGAPLILGADDTIERRPSRRIRARGLYRDPVRSTKAHVVRAWGLKWVSLMVLVKVPFSKRVWALPFLTALVRGEKRHNGPRRHKKAPEFVRQMARLVREWMPDRAIVLVLDGGFACVELALACAASDITMVSRLRLDARLFHPPSPQPKGKRGPKPQKGARQRSLAQWAARSDTPWQEVEVDWYGGGRKTVQLLSRTALWHRQGKAPVPVRWVLVRDPEGRCRDEAFFCTQVDASPEQIIAWFVMRWSVEVTFQEARAQLGFQTQRQWSDLAIERTTPALLALFSIVTLVAVRLHKGGHLSVATSAWYAKTEPTFSDCLAAVRRRIWPALHLPHSGKTPDIVQFPRDDFDRLLAQLLAAA